MAGQFSVVDSSWELIDPNPDIHQLFSQFNEQFFWGKLSSVYVQWSPRMTLCAGVCKYHGRNRECSVHLSKPLLSYRPRKDLVETLLHEMIHAYLFIADNDRERESHGPKFHEHMYRINRLTGANITVYHSFHDEVRHFKTHWWKCNGPCQTRPPYFGVVKRSMNRAPGPNDFWYKDHQKNCGGSFIKIKEPSPKKAVKRKKDSECQGNKEGNENKSKVKNKITNYFTSPTSTPSSSANATNSTIPTSFGSSTSTSPSQIGATINNVEPFAGRGFVLGSIGNNPGTGSGNAFSRNLFGTSSATSSSSSGGGIGGTKIGGAATQSQPPRRGEHPLLAKWAQNRKDSTAVPGRLTSKKVETVTRPTSTNDFWDFGGSSSGSSSGMGFSSSAASTNKKKPRVEIIDLD